MDWNLKKPSWDFTQFEQGNSPNASSVSGSSNFGVRGAFSVDLKLGHVVNASNETPGNSQGSSSVPKMGLLSPGSLKRARAVNNGVQVASCLVDGCQADLSNCKEYHRRHKVCEMHSKTPEVTIGGHKQRFCQQCSRFHSLEEFDEGKRSCRKRLDGHNRRRRKPQPDPLSRSTNFLSNYQGSRLFPLSTPEVYPTTALANPIWAGVAKTKQEDDLYNQQMHRNLLDKQNPYHGSSSSSYEGEGKQFSFLQGTTLALSNQAGPEASSGQPFHRTVASLGSGGGGRETFCDGLSTQVLNSSSALSLLSSLPLQASHEINLTRLVPPTSIPSVHPLGRSLHSSSLESMDSPVVPNASDTDIPCHGTLPMGRDSSSENDASQTLPFCWE